MANQIEFQLFAPYNKEAALIGDFSDWEPIPMKKNDQGYFCTSVELEDGEYEYKFRIRSKSWFLEPDQWIDIVDPYVTNVNDLADPSGIVRVKDGKKIVDTYVWKHDDKPLPQNETLVIYEMHIGDFSGGEDDPYGRGQFKHVIEKLDYLSDLGINAIELMPVNEFPGEDSWGYNPRYFFAVESSYGSTAEFKQLVDECHGRGIRVLMDGIYNHSEASSPLTQIDHDYWYHHEPRDPDNSWGPEFNYEHYDENLDVKPAWQFIGDIIKFWIQEYHLDGIRYDAARQIANYDFMHWIADQAQLHASMKPFLNIAEHIPETTEITNFEGPMDTCWHDSFYHTIKEHICGDRFELEKLKDVIDCKRQGFLGAVNVINYLTNHDHPRMMQELGQRDIFGEEAFARVKLGTDILFTAVGIPLILMGEEFGDYQTNSPDSNKIDWTLLKNDENKSLLEYYQGLINLRKSNHALYTANIDFFFEQENSKVFAYTRWNGEGSRVVLVANFSDQFLGQYEVSNFPADGTWHEWTRSYNLDANEGKIKLDLGPYESQIFVWQ